MRPRKTPSSPGAGLASAAVILGLFGCGVEPRPATLITDLQVVAVVAEPAQPAPGEDLRLEVFLANPEGLEIELLLWSCTSAETACAEHLLEDDTAWIATPEVVDGVAVVERQLPEVPEEWQELVESYGESVLEAGAVRLYVLACEVDRCPIIAEARAELDSPMDLREEDELARDLADPTRWLADLPMERTSFATRGLPGRLGGEGNINPTVEQRFLAEGEGSVVVEPGAFLDVGLAITEPDDPGVAVMPLSTLGAFDSRRRWDEDGDVRFWLQVPEEPAKGRMWVVVEDGSGGFGVLDLDVTVEAP